MASESGLNDSLTGTEKAVSFEIQALPELRAEVVHSLVKWKKNGTWSRVVMLLLQKAHI